MSVHDKNIRRKTVRDILRQKGDDPVVCLTAYTAPVARIADEYADILLVGDSLGMVIYGLESTVPVSVDMMINHGSAVVRSTHKALVVIDMPFGSYQEGKAQAFRNAALIMKQTGAPAVKLEGGAEMAETISFLTQRGVPVMGHIGLQPQSVHVEGGYRVTGRSEKERKKIIADARAVAKAGAFSIVLECMDPDLAAEVTHDIDIPTIGIGASAACDGQILVIDDMIGLSTDGVPKFVKKYAHVADDIKGAVRSYAEEVKSGSFPALEHEYRTGSNEKKFKVMT